MGTLTRCYPTQAFPGTKIAGPVQGDWEDWGFSPTWHEQVSGPNLISTTKTNGGLTTSIQANTNQQGNFDSFIRRYITRPLAAQTISGTFDLCAFVQAAWIDPVLSPSSDSAVVFKVHIYATIGESSEVRAVLLDNYVDSVNFPGPGSSHWQSLSAPQALTSSVIQDGDCIMVEFGVRVVSSPTPTPGYPPPIPPGNNYTSIPHLFIGTTNGSGTTRTDATAGGTVVTFAPWMEFSVGITEKADADPPANDACADAIVISATPYKSPRINTAFSAGTEREVWFTYTAEETGRLIVTTWGSNYITQIDAGTGSCASVSFHLPVERRDRQENASAQYDVTEGETWFFRIRNYGNLTLGFGAPSSGGSLQLRLLYKRAIEADDLVLPAGNVGVFREGQLINTTAALYSQAPAGVAIDYTQRPMDSFNGGTHEDYRVLIGTFSGDLIFILDLDSLNVGEFEIDDIFDPLETDLTPGNPVSKHPATLHIDADGLLYVAFFGNGFLYVAGYGTSVPSILNDVPSDPTTYGGIRVLDATSGDNQSGAPFTATIIEGDAEVTNPWAIDKTRDTGIIRYTSGGFYIPVGGTEIKQISASGAQQADLATIPLQSGHNPGIKGLVNLPDGGVLVCNSTVVHRVSAAGAIVGTYTPSVPLQSQCLVDVKLTADGASFWVVDEFSVYLFKAQLSDMSEIAYYETDMLTGTLTQMAIVQPVPPPVIVVPEVECPVFELQPQVSTISRFRESVPGSSSAANTDTECPLVGDSSPISNPMRLR